MKYLLALLGGVVLGGTLVFFLVAGAPRVHKMPGAIVRPPDQGGDPPGTALLTLDEKFFEALMGTIFQDLGTPAFQLSSFAEKPLSDRSPEIFAAALQGAGCQNQITLLKESNNIKTGVRLADGKISAPLAFSGTYSLFGNCVNFKGWAQTNFQLRFDEPNQKLYGQVTVEGVNLEGTQPLVGGIVTPLVQNAINQRVNPVEILRSSQLKVAVPVHASNGTLNAQVKDVRAEVKDGALVLHIFYDFSGVRGPQQPQPG